MVLPVRSLGNTVGQLCSTNKKSFYSAGMDCGTHWQQALSGAAEPGYSGFSMAPAGGRAYTWKEDFKVRTIGMGTVVVVVVVKMAHTMPYFFSSYFPNCSQISHSRFTKTLCNRFGLQYTDEEPESSWRVNSCVETRGITGPRSHRS